MDEAAGWQQGMDEEMTNLRKLGCWAVIPWSSLPPNTPILGTLWTYRKKADEYGTLTRLRSRHNTLTPLSHSLTHSLSLCSLSLSRSLARSFVYQ